MTIYQTREAVRGNPVGPGWGGQLIVKQLHVPFAAAMLDNANDEVEIYKMPAGAVLVFAVISATDMDTGTPALAFDIGDDDVEDRIFAASNVGQAGTLSSAMAPTAHGYKYDDETVIKAYVKTAADTEAAGTLRLTLMYFIDPNFAATEVIA